METVNVNGYYTFEKLWTPWGCELFQLYHVYEDCPIGVSSNIVEEYDGYNKYECPVCCVGVGTQRE